MSEVEMGAVVGIVVAVLTIAVGQRLSPIMLGGLFSVLLGAAAGVYVGAALTKPAGLELLLSVAVFIGFCFVATRWTTALRILAVAWVAHGLWDIAGLSGLLQSGVAVWYKVGCAVADLIWGIYLYAKANTNSTQYEYRLPL